MASRGLLERSAAGGVDLAAAGIRWGRRPANPAPVGLTRRDLWLLLLLYEVGFLSASHLFLLGWGRVSSRASTRLKQLHDVGLVDKFRAPAPAGSQEWNYRLALEGWRRLVSHGLLEPVPVYRPVELMSIAYAEHDLQVAGLVLSIAHQAVGDMEGGLWERLPFTWQVRSGVLDITRDPVVGVRSPASREHWRDHHHPRNSRSGVLEPDATLRWIQDDGTRSSLLIEYDRTRRPTTQVNRLRRYDRFLLDGWSSGRFACDDFVPFVMYVTTSERALRGLVQVADETLSAYHAPDGWGPDYGTHPARERMLFTTRQRLLAGNWDMWMVPDRPHHRQILGPAKRRVKPWIRPYSLIPALRHGHAPDNDAASPPTPGTARAGADPPGRPASASSPSPPAVHIHAPVESWSARETNSPLTTSDRGSDPGPWP